MSRADGRADGLYITTDELDRLVGVPDIVFRLYFALLKVRDFMTGMVGAKSPHISWQALGESLEVEPHPGIKRSKPSKDQLRRAAAWLERRGLVEMRSNARQWHLIFFLPMARRGFFDPNKAAMNPPRKAASGAQRENKGKATPPDSAEAATHQGSVYQYYVGDSNPQAVDNLIVSPSVTATEKAKILDAISGAHVNGHAQAILDEHTWYAEKGAIRRTSLAFVMGCIKKARAGTFVPEKGKEIAARRTRASQDQKTEDWPFPGTFAQDAKPTEPPRRRTRPNTGAIREFLPNYKGGKS